MSEQTVDLLADVFPGTEDAPLPRWASGELRALNMDHLIPAADDHRWGPIRDVEERRKERLE